MLYLDLNRFKELTIMPGTDVDALEALEAGWILRQVERVGSAINARLVKRYAVPFGADGTPRTDVPGIIEDWIVAIVTLRAYAKRGFNPSDAMADVAIVQPAAEAEAAIKEAANSETGLFELPLLDSDVVGGVTKTGPLAYTETSPFVWTDVQSEAGYAEDAARSGT